MLFLFLLFSCILSLTGFWLFLSLYKFVERKGEFMNEKALRILEYHKIIEQLENCATSPLGKALSKKLTPVSDLG